MLDDNDEFVVEWVNYTCPGCGGYRENGCSTCAEYNFFYGQVVAHDDTILTIQEVHDEVIRRMEMAA